MTWPAALPGAALRSPRTAAGRRARQVAVRVALRLALLVGGLFALGFLCGGQASAAEDIPAATTAAVDGATTGATGVAPAPVAGEPTAQLTGESKADDDTAAATKSSPLGGGTDAATSALLPPAVDDKVLRPVTEHVVGAVDGKVLQPVGDLVETVTEQLAGAPAKMPPMPTWPAPELPGLPEYPGFPGLPTLPELPGLPGQTPPVTTAPQPESPVAGSPSSEGDDSGKRSGKAVTRAAFYGPASVAGSPTTGAAPRTDGHRAAVQDAHAPVQQAPDGDPGGLRGNRSAVDGGSSRHGDAQAVSLDHRAAVRLVAGTAVAAEAFETRDRHRDIPVSPA
ncbi:hypothetical protein [Streptomyces sp. RG80]|uniref:hypothetical protein n=1 Tax=Streptomyces sp. RG80 TaxID=3157340 RepID=UPI00338F882E